MSPQGERPAGDEDGWWDELYDTDAPDTGPAATGDTLDDRFASASDTVTVPPARPAPEVPAGRPPTRPERRAAPAGPPARPRGDHDRAPWEPPGGPTGPRTFPGAASPAPPASGSRAPRPPRPRGEYVGDGPPTYEPEPTALPPAHPHQLDELVADTVLDGARYGTYTLRAASVRGDSARNRGEPRRDALLTARFGTGEAALVLVAVATGDRAAEAGHLAAADACRWIGEAVGRHHVRLGEDIRAGRRGDLKSGLHRLTARAYGRLRARATDLGLEPGRYTASLRCLLLTADPGCRTRVFFGVGEGGLFRLRGGAWQDIEPPPPDPAALTGEAVVVGSPPGPARSGPSAPPVPEDPPAPDDPPGPPAGAFRFRASVARPGDTLLLAGRGFAEPLRGEPALAEELAERWAAEEPPGLAAFLADTQLRTKGYADDRTAVAVWEA
ncbi:protein phosphatase 2C domain-containing protein [Streptomyces sp. NPDC050856]|uniref:protein phosphatase 2C domain-containing protein n=1 Tax=Streptomyces sp. NPDC050856 TaxID=3154939 RepID=UPI0033C197C4